MKTAFQGISDDKVWAAIEESRSSSNSDDRKLKDVEFATLCSSKEEIGENKPDGDFYARALPKGEWDAGWMQGIQRVVLVHRLREVVALLGFTRIEPATKDISGELDIGVQRADIARDISWLPACEHRGEGVFLQFNEEALRRIPMGTPASLIKVTNSPIDPVKHSKTWSPGRKSEVKDEPN